MEADPTTTPEPIFAVEGEPTDEFFDALAALLIEAQMKEADGRNEATAGAGGTNE